MISLLVTNSFQVRYNRGKISQFARCYGASKIMNGKILNFNFLLNFGRLYWLYFKHFPQRAHKTNDHTL